MTSHVWRRSLCSTETWNFLRDQVSFWCFVTYLPVSLHWHSKLLHSDMLLIYGFTNGRPWTSATQNKCESYIYIYICRLLYRWYNIMYRLGWFHQQSPIFSWFGRTYVFEHFFDPAPFGRTHGCIGCTGWATQACSGEIGGIEVSTLRIFTNDENPIESVFPLLQEDHIAVKCPLKMWLH